MEDEKTMEQTAEEAPLEENGQEPEAEKPQQNSLVKAAGAAAGEALDNVAKAAEKAAEYVVTEGAKAAKRLTTPRTPAPEIFVQFYGDEVAAAALAEAAAAQFREENKRTKISEFKLYVKPEERAAYYVINGSFTGKVDF